MKQIKSVHTKPTFPLYAVNNSLSERKLIELVNSVCTKQQFRAESSALNYMRSNVDCQQN